MANEPKISKEEVINILEEGFKFNTSKHWNEREEEFIMDGLITILKQDNVYFNLEKEEFRKILDEDYQSKGLNRSVNIEALIGKTGLIFLIPDGHGLFSPEARNKLEGFRLPTRSMLSGIELESAALVINKEHKIVKPIIRKWALEKYAGEASITYQNPEYSFHFLEPISEEIFGGFKNKMEIKNGLVFSDYFQIENEPELDYEDTGISGRYQLQQEYFERGMVYAQTSNTLLTIFKKDNEIYVLDKADMLFRPEDYDYKLKKSDKELLKSLKGFNSLEEEFSCHMWRMMATDSKTEYLNEDRDIVSVPVDSGTYEVEAYDIDQRMMDKNKSKFLIAHFKKIA